MKNGDEEKIVIGFGFIEEKASLSNAIYEYNISSNKMSILFEGSEEGKECTTFNI